MDKKKVLTLQKRHREKIQCEIYFNPCKSWLKKAWENLEARSEPNFFLSWVWIGSWINCFVNDFFVIEARKNNTIVGLGILVKTSSKFLNIPYKNKFYLHRCGLEEYDQIWIEYNDFLMEEGNEANIRSAMIECIVYNLAKKNAIVIGASDENKFAHAEDLNLVKRTLWQTKNYMLNLDILRERNQTLLQYLSRNSRYQILRSIRKYQSQYGDITLTKATSYQEAKEMLSLAKPLHLARWNGSPNKSGFANPHFIKLHEHLIENGLPTKNIDLYHIKAGEHSISIMYNFRYKNRVYFYLSAINYENTSAQLKPGLLSHFLLINKAIEEGLSLYDFMGGASRYKKSFSNMEGDLSVNIYEHASLRVKIEHVFRNSKSKLQNKSFEISHQHLF